MPLPHHLFAVVSRVETPRATRKSITEIRREKSQELQAKQAVDRANAILDAIAARQSSLKARIEALQRQQRVLVSREERISDRIIATLEANALTRADGFGSQVMITPSPAAVDIVDAQLVPAEYLRTPKAPAAVPDKPKIKAAIEHGVKVPGARLVQGVTLRRS